MCVATTRTEHVSIPNLTMTQNVLGTLIGVRDGKRNRHHQQAVAASRMIKGRKERMSEANKLIYRLEDYLDAEAETLWKLDTQMKKGHEFTAAYNEGKKEGGHEVIRAVASIIRAFKDTNTPDSEVTAYKDYILHLNLGDNETPLAIADALIKYFGNKRTNLDGEAMESLRVVGEALLSEYKRIEKIRELNK